MSTNNKNKKETTTIRVRKDTKNKLSTLAEEQGLSMMEYLDNFAFKNVISNDHSDDKIVWEPIPNPTVSGKLGTYPNDDNLITLGIVQNEKSINQLLSMNEADISNLIITGPTGTGKTALSKNIILGLIKSKRTGPVIVSNMYKEMQKDLVTEIMRSNPDKLKEILIVNDFVPQNILDVKSEEEINQLAMDNLRKLFMVFEGLTNTNIDLPPVYALYLEAVVRALCEANLKIKNKKDKYTILDIFSFLKSEEMRKKLVSDQSSEIVRELFGEDGLWKTKNHEFKNVLLENMLKINNIINAIPNAHIIRDGNDNYEVIINALKENKVIILEPKNNTVSHKYIINSLLETIQITAEELKLHKLVIIGDELHLENLKTRSVNTKYEFIITSQRNPEFFYKVYFRNHISLDTSAKIINRNNKNKHIPGSQVDTRLGSSISYYGAARIKDISGSDYFTIKMLPPFTKDQGYINTKEELSDQVDAFIKNNQ